MPTKWAGFITMIMIVILYYLPAFSILVMAIMLMKVYPDKKKKILAYSIPFFAIAFLFNYYYLDKENKEASAKEPKQEQVRQDNENENTTAEEAQVNETSTNVIETETAGSETNTNSAIEEAVKNYENALPEAVNQGDFTIVESFLLSDSPLYHAQIDLVNNLYSKNITENLYNFEIVSMNQETEDIYSVETNEEYGIVKNGKEERKTYKWIYTIQNVDGQWLLSDIHK
ncbi:hypothetical protein V7161_30020 [Neobacillus drentensis]|uniref:TcaA NTF2-like domain-containing protein n=1 Tax=Neobacillus drentensis TaxID=220684 RepID=UPI0030010CF1